MAMKLVRKKNQRGEVLRELRADEEMAVKNFYGLRKRGNSVEFRLAETLIREMRQCEAWLECDCVPGDSPAMNSAKLMKDTQTLYLSSFNHEHELSCPMHRPLDTDPGATSSGTRKKAGSRRLSYRDFLPPDEQEATVKAPGRVALPAEERTRRTRRSRIARLLLTLIEDARINYLSHLSPLPSGSVMDSINALKAVTDAQEFIHERKLSDIVRFQPGLGETGKERLMQDLEKPDSRWPARRARMFFQIFMSDRVSRDEVVFTWSGGDISFRPERGMRINGEGQDGVRPPYWVILAFRRGNDGRVICSEGYAHALFRRSCPVPVDSELERQTLKSLSEADRWMKNKPDAPRLSLQKPLFDVEVNIDGEKGFVLPDFIVTAVTPDGKSHNIVVETMGYDDDDYCERKAEQHKGMRSIGVLQTDPPRWPRANEKAFVNHIYGVFLHINK